MGTLDRNSHLEYWYECQASSSVIREGEAGLDWTKERSLPCPSGRLTGGLRRGWRLSKAVHSRRRKGVSRDTGYGGHHFCLSRRRRRREGRSGVVILFALMLCMCALVTCGGPPLAPSSWTRLCSWMLAILRSSRVFCHNSNCVEDEMMRRLMRCSSKLPAHSPPLSSSTPSFGTSVPSRISRKTRHPPKLLRFA